MSWIVLGIAGAGAAGFFLAKENQPKAPKIPPPPGLSTEGGAAQRQLRSIITSGLSGQGLTPELTNRAERALLDEIQKQKGIALADLPGRLNRFIPKEDIGVRTFAKEEIGREAARKRFSVEREFDLIPELERQEAIDLGLTSIANEKRLALTLASGFNEQQLRLAQSPSFGSEFSAGLGSGIGQFAGSRRQNPETNQQLFSRLFNQENSFFRQ